MFIAFVIGDDLLEFHQAVVSTLRDADDAPVPLDPAPMLPPLQPNNPLLTHTNEDMARLSEMHNDLGPDQGEDEADTGKLYVPTLNTYSLSEFGNIYTNIYMLIAWVNIFLVANMKCGIYIGTQQNYTRYLTFVKLSLAFELIV